MSEKVPEAVSFETSLAESKSKFDVMKKRRRTYESFHEVSHQDHPPTSYLETMMHLLKGNIGPGTYAMADAMKNSGIVLGPILTVIIGLIAVHAQHMLIKSAEFIKTQENLDTSPTYAETVELSFLTSKSEKWRKLASLMKKLCNIFICVTQLGFCSVYLLFIGKNLKEVAEFHEIDFNIHYWVTIGLIPVWMTAMIRTLKLIAICSAIANVCMGLGIILTISYLVYDLPHITGVEQFASIEKLPFFFGIALYTFEGIALVLPLKNAMKKPRNFNRLAGVLNVGMLIATTMYLSIGILGYWRYGDNTLGSVTLNLDTKDGLARAIKMMVTLGVLLGYAIQFFVAIQIMFVPLLDQWSFAFTHPIICELIFRTLIVLVTYTVAMVVPDLTLLLSLIGSVCSTVLAFVFPAVCELILTNNFDGGIPIWCWLKNSIILLISVLGMTMGGALSLKEIVESFME